MKVDAETAWHELCRFADACGIELDERAAPGAEPPGADESAVSDYATLLGVIQSGRLVVDELGDAKLAIQRPAPGGFTEIEVKPSCWQYGAALSAASAGPVSANAKLRAGADTGISRIHRFLESLAGLKPGALATLQHRPDCMTVFRLGQFIISE